MRRDIDISRNRFEDRGSCFERFEITLGLEIDAILLSPTCICIYIQKYYSRTNEFPFGRRCGEYTVEKRTNKLDGEQ